MPVFHLRPFRDTTDYAGMAAVLTASEQADGVQRQVSAEALAAAYAGLEHCNPQEDVALAQTASGELAGYVRGGWRDEADAQLYDSSGFVAPAWRGQGVGRALLAWVEERLRQIAAGQPARAARFFQAEADQRQTAKARLLERAGYQPVRYFLEMVRPTLDDLPDFPLPAGLELRPVTPEHYRALWQSIDEISRDEWGYTPATEAGYQAWLAGPHFQPQLWPVAWDPAAGTIAGHALPFVEAGENAQFNRQRGYTEGIGVDRAWRRRGLARALLGRSLRALKAAGCSEAALAADGDNPSGAVRLYERCGFQVVNASTLYRKALAGEDGRLG